MPQSPRVSLKDQIDHIVDVALRGNRGSQQGWALIKKDIKQDKTDAEWIGTATLYFEKTRGQKSNLDVVEKQWSIIQGKIFKAGFSSKYNKYPWKIINEDATDDPKDSELLDMTDEDAKTASNIKIEMPTDVHDVLIPNKILTISDLKDRFPHALLNGSDTEIEQHEAFKGIYARGPQIRSVLSSIWSFAQSNGERANHTLLYGLPAAAKTQILLGIIKLFGDGAALRLDSTNTTRAGLERLIFKDLKAVPPIFICEEIEKADEQALRVWLGAMDDRHEFRKVNFHMHQVRKVYFISLATANDKEKFDLLMGGRPGYPGALSSRFVHQYVCPRPNEEQMKRILARNISSFGGNMDWIEPCILLARQLKTDDPRKVLGFLDGGDRLLSGEFQKDQLSMQK